MKKIITLLVFTLFLVFPVEAQEISPADTICFTVEEAQEIQQRVQTLERRDSLNTLIIAEMENQIDLYERRIDIQEEKLNLVQEEFDLFKEKTGYTEVEQMRESLQRRRWYYTAGGTIVGVLVGVFAFN